MTIYSPRQSTIRKLFAVSRNQCAFPECTTPIVDNATGTILAEVCHIHAQKIGGPRYDENQSAEDRHGFDNLVLMCRNHHKVIDDQNNLKAFNPTYLKQIKREHETASSLSESELPELTDSLIRALKLTATTYDSGSVHMDFRDATFKVGGEGGHLGGGGGSGGVLTIVGLGRLPHEIMADFNGEDGKAPGGGGGGGGAITFVGREIEPSDINGGLQISSIFTANSASIENLLNVLGAAWTFCPIPSIPNNVNIRLIFIVECGEALPGTLLRFGIEVSDPQGKINHTTFHDVEVPELKEQICRVPVLKQLNFTVDSYGIWKIAVFGGKQLLAEYKFEFRKGQNIPV